MQKGSGSMIGEAQTEAAAGCVVDRWSLTGDQLGSQLVQNREMQKEMGWKEVI